MKGLGKMIKQIKWINVETVINVYIITKKERSI